MFLWNNAVAGKRKGGIYLQDRRILIIRWDLSSLLFLPISVGIGWIITTGTMVQTVSRPRFPWYSLDHTWALLRLIPWIFDSFGCQLSNGSRLIRSAKIFTCFIRSNVCEAIVSTFCFVLLSYIYRLKHNNLIMLHGTFLAVQWLILCFQGQEHGFDP